MITDKETAAAVGSVHDVGAQPESVTEAGPQTQYSHRGHIPPVAPLVDALTPSASDRAFGEVGRSQQAVVQASSDVAVDEDASKSAGPTGGRFSGDGDLGDVERGLKTLKLGDTGIAVRRVQQSLFELNYRPISVNGTYDQATSDHVKAYQQANNLTRQDGTLDAATFLHLEKQFFSLGQYARAAKHAPPGVHDTPDGRDRKRGGTAIEPVLLEETHALDTEDKQVLGKPEASLGYPWHGNDMPDAEQLWLQRGIVIVANPKFLDAVLRVAVFAPGLSLDAYKQSVRYVDTDTTDDG